MKYYLGKFKDKRFEPVNCIEETDILSVLNFTSKFNDEDDLKRYLVEENLIDGTEHLAYVYKKKNDYVKLFNGDALTFSFAKEYNTGSGLYKTLVKEKYNKELYTFLSKMILSKYDKVKNHIAERENILQVFREVLYANELGVDKYEDTIDKDKLNVLIRNFVRSSIGIYDKDKKAYKITDGRYDVDKRKLADLILMLNNYYNEKIRETIYGYIDGYNDRNMNGKKDTYEEIEGYEKEEFLTDEDFENQGMNPNDYKKLIRN